jgi:polyphosphate:AMP phosphotransferase
VFEILKLKHKIGKADYKAQEPQLRGDLIDVQFDLLESGEFPVVVLLGGMDIPGRSEMAKQLMSWMDPRHIRPFAMFRPSAEEQERPRMWRFWRALPRSGRIGVFLNSWYEGPALDYFLGHIDQASFRARIEEIVRFERMLALEGVLRLKFMFIVDEKQNIKDIERLRKDHSVAWKVAEEELELGKQFAERYDNVVKVIEELVSATSTSYAPWIALPSADMRYRDLTIGRTIVEAVRGRLDNPAPAIPAAGPSPAIGSNGGNILDTLDLSQSLDRAAYDTNLKKEQRRLSQLTLSEQFEDRALVAVFEGNDAGGKGGSIRRVVQALDPRMLRIIPIAAPSEVEKAHPYLWRFWSHVPRKGHVTIFDRSWYGRVLVERVEGFATEDEWQRAYEEIRAFEAELADYGVIVVKFWLAIDPDEQLARFKAREEIGYKRHKITDEDWRNREKWDDYAHAVHDMVERTSTSAAPWTLVEANDKYHARIKVLKTLADRLKAEL